MTLIVRTEATDHGWEWRCDSPCWLKPRRTLYFISRTVNGVREDFTDKRGRLRTWRTVEGAKKKLEKLIEAKGGPVLLDELLRCPCRVRPAGTRAAGRQFMLSAVTATGGVIGIAAYRIGAKRPAPSQHLLLSVRSREEWFSRLRLC